MRRVERRTAKHGEQRAGPPTKRENATLAPSRNTEVAGQIQGMKEKQAQTLRDAWGERLCPHPAFSREYDQAGARTGDYFCSQCGAKFSFRERAELLARRPETER